LFLHQGVQTSARAFW